MSTRHSLAQRVAGLEATKRGGGGGALTPAERAELGRLEEIDSYWAGRIEAGDMSSEECDQWMTDHSIDGNNGRLDELRRRNRTPEEVAADAAEDARLGKMSWQEIRAEIEARDRGEHT